MKKHIVAWSLVSMLAFCMGLGADASSSRTIKADVQAIRIPAGTNMKLELLSPISTKVASVGDEVILRLSDGSEIPAEISYIVQENKDRILVFRVTEGVEKLVEYRKISFEIVWWSYSGWKISNSAIVEENDLSYVYVSKAGVPEKVLVKVLRQNDTYSIVENYTNDELVELGYSVDEIQNMSQIKLFDQIIIKNE